ncbi:MAG: M28 family peptidase [Planctomycetes bacterium]|nr:M28 family peptidase [Planctomycetota bacterium]
MVILASHYDTKLARGRFARPFVGANDGGSSTAVLLELARALAKAGPRTLTYRFLFLDGEEAVRWDWAGEDNTYGSRQHAQALPAGAAAQVARSSCSTWSATRSSRSSATRTPTAGCRPSSSTPRARPVWASTSTAPPRRSATTTCASATRASRRST